MDLGFAALAVNLDDKAAGGLLMRVDERVCVEGCIPVCR